MAEGRKAISKAMRQQVYDSLNVKTGGENEANE